MPGQYIVRLISSKDHNADKEELLKLIRRTGTDRYDGRKQMFADFYDKHDVDFFGSVIEAKKASEEILRLRKEFAAKTEGDRGRKIVPDIAILYDPARCRMIENVYEGAKASDCFQFATDPVSALVEVREI